MTQQAFYFDGTRCTGCKTCEIACKDYKDIELGLTYRRVYELTAGETVKSSDGSITTNCSCYSLSLACNHCTSPICVEVCPTGAMHKESETGIVLVDTTKCIGCGYCHMSCPYNAPQVNRSKGYSVKCDGCFERVTEGQKPVCVEACPARALDFVAEEEAAKKGDQGAIAPLPDPGFTNPNLYINASADAKSSLVADVEIANRLEVQ